MKGRGRQVFAYTADPPTWSTATALVAAVIADHGHVDILVNNAGRSIRRSIEPATTASHDFERTMQLNYFRLLRLIMGFMPTMTQRRKATSSTSLDRRAGELAAILRHVASKAALTFSRCAQGELSGTGHQLQPPSTCRWLKTPMIARPRCMTACRR